MGLRFLSRKSFSGIELNGADRSVERATADKRYGPLRVPLKTKHSMLTVPSRAHPFRLWRVRAWPPNARVVKWQTRTFEGRMPQGVGVQVPPRAEEEI